MTQPRFDGIRSRVALKDFETGLETLFMAAWRGKGKTAGLKPCRYSFKMQAIYFAKLRTASASVLNTSKTVNSLVICRTSWNLLPRWQRRRAAPCDFTL